MTQRLQRLHQFFQMDGLAVPRGDAVMEKNSHDSVNSPSLVPGRLPRLVLFRDAAFIAPGPLYLR